MWPGPEGAGVEPGATAAQPSTEVWRGRGSSHEKIVVLFPCERL